MLRVGVVCAVPLLLLACGGGGSSGKKSGSSDGTAAVMEDVSGLVSKGPVAGATINVYRLGADGTPGARVAGPIETGADGSWSVQIDASVPRPLAVVSSGGTYTDEATGNPVTAGELNSFLPDGSDTVAVTPLTDLLVQVTRNHLAANPGADVDAGLDAARDTLASVLAVGFDPLTVVPANPEDTTGASSDALAYAAVLGGLSEMANTVAPGTDPFAVIQALVTDMTDGSIDGQADGAAVPLGETDLDVSGASLNDSIADFTTANQDFAAVAVYVASFASVGDNGTVSPASANVLSGGSTVFTLTPATGYNVSAIDGCGGTLTANQYTTGAITADCQMNVSFALNEYAVSVQSGSGGSVAPDTATVLHGETTAFEVTPDEGYSITSVSGCGGELNGTTFTTAAVTAACTVTASFAINSYTVTVDAGAGGNLAPESANVNYGSTTSFTVTPDTGFEIASVSGCGGTLDGSTFTTAAVTANCTVSASFSLRSYNLTASAGTGGGISPASVDVTHGDSTSFTLSTDTGYEIAAVTGCGGTLDGSTYTTGTITAACNVSASFSLIQIAVSTNAGANGSISPTSRDVAYGNTTSFTITPASGYQIESVTGCDGSLSGSTYTTAAITAECSVSATFSESNVTPTDAVWDQFNWDEANWQ